MDESNKCRVRQVIITADDFGRSHNVNVAIMRAHREGVLTSASLMVTGDAVEEAVAFARATPTLAVGLHVVLVQGCAALSPETIPHLVDAQGCFMRDPARAGLYYFVNRAARRELACELRAQFERFAATGLPLAHVDGHLHMHVHPTVFHLLLPLAAQYGAGGIRLPRDDFWLGMQCDHRHAGTKMAWALSFGLLCRWCMRHLRAQPLAVANRVYGLMQSGQMHEGYVIQILRQLAAPDAELYFHPSIACEGDPLGPNPGDLAALLSPTVRQVIQEQGIRLATYPLLSAR